MIEKKFRRSPINAAIPFALAIAAPAAFAGDGPYIGLEGGANFMHSNDNKSAGQEVFHTYYNDGWLGGLTAGYGFANGLRPEFEMAYRRNDYDEITAPGGFASNDVGGRKDATTAMANLWYDVKSDHGLFKTFHPYIGGGVGAARIDEHHLSYAGTDLVNDFHTRFAYQGGAGVGLDLSPHVTLSVDYRYLASNKTSYATTAAFVAAGAPDSVESAYRSQSAMLGLRYSFGEAPKPMPVAAPYVPPPAPPPPPPPPVRDSDGDGVPDDIDKCPNTPPGFKVDATGCIIQQTVILRTVNFEFNSDKLTGPAQDSLSQVAAALAGQPELNVEIDGHTDSVGSAPYNLKLSKKRAESVKTYLVSKGANGAKLTAQGFGKTKPIASNETEEGRTENRRVEFQVLNQPPTVKVISKEASAASKAAAEGSAPAPKHKMKKKSTSTAPTTP